MAWKIALGEVAPGPASQALEEDRCGRPVPAEQDDARRRAQSSQAGENAERLKRGRHGIEQEHPGPVATKETGRVCETNATALDTIAPGTSEDRVAALPQLV